MSCPGAIMEARLDRDGAIGWAERYHAEQGRWPTRRFRVEGSRVGNSRLLRQGEASAMAERYGGELVELVPSPEEYRQYCDAVGRECVLGPRSKKKGRS